MPDRWLSDPDPDIDETLRLADALESLDSPADTREDPGLAALVRTAARVRQAAAAVEPRREYANRSRAFLWGSLRRTDETAATQAKLSRARRALLLAPFASAAAAAAVTAMVFLAGSGGGSAASPAGESVVSVAAPVETPGFDESVAADASDNATALSLTAELDRIESALTDIEQRSGRLEIVEGDLLRQVTESTATVAKQIDDAPVTVSQEAVVSYIRAAHTGRVVLDDVRVAPQDAPALAAAQRTAEDGVVVASRYLVARLAEQPGAPAPRPSALNPGPRSGVAAEDGVEEVPQ